MDKKISVGRYNTLKIDRLTEFGFYLIDKEENSVLLPKVYINDDMKIGDLIEVFIYTDSEDRLIATTLKPKGVVGDIVALQVIDIANFGIFMDWGLPKNLLVPKKFQDGHYEVGETRVIKILEDRETNRVFGAEKFMDYLSGDTRTLKRNQEVDLIVIKKTDLGYKVIINNDFEGLIFHNKVFRPLAIGDRVKGYINIVRRDNKIDVILQPIGKKSSLLGSEKVLEALSQNSGKVPFTYKSDADDISRTFGLSKKLFKKSLTELIEKKKIKLNENSIELI